MRAVLPPREVWGYLSWAAAAGLALRRRGTWWRGDGTMPAGVGAGRRLRSVLRQAPPSGRAGASSERHMPAQRGSPGSPLSAFNARLASARCSGQPCWGRQTRAAPPGGPTSWWKRARGAGRRWFYRQLGLRHATHWLRPAAAARIRQEAMNFFGLYWRAWAGRAADGGCIATCGLGHRASQLQLPPDRRDGHTFRFGAYRPAACVARAARRIAGSTAAERRRGDPGS